MLVDSRELRRFVVRIGRPGGGTLGTGFYAAPGWVVTCAHVVGNLPEAVVTPAEPLAGVSHGVWRVAARSILPPPGWNSGFWPFPDLAVLRSEDAGEHPVPLLEARDPVGDHECHSWGYAVRETNLEPSGSPATFRFEGVEGDGFLRLKAGQAAPGLSGSPLVCPSRRAVVGVVAVSRDTRSDLGGWAVPISALLRSGDSLPAALAEAGEVVRPANRASVIRFRREWNAVLPVDADSMLGQPWEEFRRGPRSVPSSLLRADFGVVPFLFRDGELNAAEQWCQQADWATPMSVMRVTARGGAGKTRFAIELCKRLASAGWATGMWRGNSGISRLPAPRLVVIDYAEEALAATLRDSLDELARHATGLAPVMVLMLTRARGRLVGDAVAEIGKDAPATLVRVLDQLQDNPVAARPLNAGQREALFREAVSRFVTAWCPAAATGAGTTGSIVPDLSDSRYEAPLDVLFEALITALELCGETTATGAGPDGRGSGESPAGRVLNHEEKYWQLTAPAAYRDDLAMLRECAGLATLAGARDLGEAGALLSVAGGLSGQEAARARADLAGWLSSLYDGPAVLNPVRPDRLGEELVRRILADQDDGGLDMLCAVLSLESDDQAERCMDVLTRLSASHEPVARTAAAAVARAHADLTQRAEEQSRPAPGRPGRTALAGACQRLLTPRFCGLVEQALADAEPANTTYRRDLSVSYNKLADLAVAAGQGDRARDLYEQSLAVAQQLADAEPANTTYRRDLSISYERLADLARAAGQGDAARQLVSQALDLRRRLVRNEPDRLDIAEELAYVMYLWAQIGPEGPDENPAQEAIILLEPFERLGYVTPRALAILAWARQAL